MRRMRNGTLVLAAALAALAVIWWGDGNLSIQQPDKPVSASAPGASRSGQSLSADAVLAIKPGLSVPRPATAPLTASPVLLEFSRARSFKALHERLSSKADRTPEEDWIVAEILQRCATTAEQKKRRPNAGNRWTLGGEQSREKLAASISEKDPNRARRLEAFEKINVDRCETVAGVEVSDKDIRGLLERASAGGDPKARASLIQKDLWAFLEARDNRLDAERLPTLSEAQLSTLKDVVASGDPEAVAIAMRAMAFPFANFSLRTGSSELALDATTWWTAAALTACELGYDCGADHRTILDACAIRGQCGAHDLREHYFYYGQSPASSQMVDEYLDGLRRARGGDWSYFTIHRGPAPNVAPYRTR